MDSAFLLFYSLSYFFDFRFQPLKFSLGIDLFRDVRNLVANHILDGVLVHPGLLGHRYKVLSAIMRAMLRIQLQFIANHSKTFLVSLVGQHRRFTAAAIRTSEQVLAAGLLRLLILCFDPGPSAGNGYPAVLF